MSAASDGQRVQREVVWTGWDHQGSEHLQLLIECDGVKVESRIEGGHDDAFRQLAISCGWTRSGECAGWRPGWTMAVNAVLSPTGLVTGGATNTGCCHR